MEVQKNIVQWTKKHYPILIPLCIYVFIISFLLAISHQFELTSVLNGGDTATYLNSQLFFEKGIYLWEDSVFGRINIVAFIQSIYSLPIIILDIFLPNTISLFVYWTILFSLIPISFYLLSFYLTKNSVISFFGGILYMFNLYVFIIHHTPVYHIVFLQGVTPLLILLCVRAYQSERLFSYEIAFIAFIFLPLLRVINMFSLYLLLIPCISLIIIRFYKNISINNKMILKKSFILIIFVLLLSTPYLIGLSVSTSQVTQTSSNVEFSMRSVLLSEDYAYLLNSIRFTGLYSFEKEWCWSETSGMMCSSSIMEPYHENPWLVMMSFYPILLTLLCVLYGFQKTGFHKKIAFALILGLSILFLFFAKMINPPLGQINEYLFYNFSPFLILFRSAWKYMQIPYILSSIVLIIFGLKELHFRLSKQKKKFYSILAVLFILQIAYIGPAVTPPNQIINKEWITKIPSEYYDLADFINEQEEEFRILPLPLSKHFTGYTPYTWGYTGPDVLYSLIDKPLVDKFHNPVLTQNQINFVTAFENLSYTNLYELLTLAKNVNVKYILLRKDIDINHPYINVWGDPNLIEKSLDRIQEIKNTYEFGNLTLYELAYVPRISIFTDIKKMQRYDAYLQFDSEKYIDYPIEITNQQIDSFSFRIRFLLHNKTDANITDWKEFNHRVIKTDFFKLSVSPKGFIYIFLYNQTKAGKGFTLDVQNLDIMEKEIKMEFYFIDDTFYIVKDGFIEDYSYTDVLYPVGGNINLGGIPNLEKMEGAVYNFSFSINQKQLLDKNNLLSEYKSMAVYEVNENISMDLDEVVKNGNLSLLKESRIEYRNVPIETLNPTKYLIHVNTSSPCTFGFMTSYNKNWIATIYQDDEIIEKQSSRPLFSNLNGFSINSTGNLKIEISYLPQAWFEIGLMITLITGFVGIIIPFYQWKHKFLSIMKNKLKISLKSMLNKNEK